MKKNECKQIILEAGNRLLEMTKFTVEEKTDFKNLVTSADKKTQEFLVQEFEKLIPSATFLCEENDMHDASGEYTFIIDPIDGTSNFIFNYDTSAISAALVHKGEILWGIVYNPFTEELYEAAKGEGAYLKDRKLEVPDNDLAHSLVGFGTSPYYEELQDRTFEISRRLLKECVDLRRSGSAALDLCYAARGSYGLFFELELQPWDYAAGMCILKEAGGVVRNMENEEPDFTKKSSIIAGSRKNVDRFFEIIK